MTFGEGPRHLRIALNIGNRALVRVGDHGEIGGIAREVGEGFAQFIGRPYMLLCYGSADQILQFSDLDAWDIAFLAQDASRREKVTFSDPYLSTEATCLVRQESSFRSIEDLDQPGVQIAATKNAAYANALNAKLRRASIVEFSTATEALDQFQARSLHAVAGIAEALRSRAMEQNGLRLLDQSFEVILQSIATPKDGGHLLPHINRYVADWRAAR